MLISNRIIQRDMTFEETLLLVIGGAASAALSASLPYYFTKKNEMEMKHREKKLDMYDDLLSKFTDFINSPSDEEKTYAFIEAYNRASAYASNEVLQACHALLLNIAKHTELREKDPNYQIPHADDDKEISKIFMAIRKDVSPKESLFVFKAFIARR